jgi:hypothetical protein
MSLLVCLYMDNEYIPKREVLTLIFTKYKLNKQEKRRGAGRRITAINRAIVVPSLFPGCLELPKFPYLLVCWASVAGSLDLSAVLAQNRHLASPMGCSPSPCSKKY